jgi:hypothetical protein
MQSNLHTTDNAKTFNLSENAGNQRDAVVEKDYPKKNSMQECRDEGEKHNKKRFGMFAAVKYLTETNRQKGSAFQPPLRRFLSDVLYDVTASRSSAPGSAHPPSL